MSDLNSEVQALQEMILDLAERMKTLSNGDKKPEAPPAPPRRTRSQIEAQVVRTVANGLPGATVKSVNGETIIEADGRRFKLKVMGPYERIRASASH